jgi:prepilin-type N-terminal cleavage/methylation domain-containing protein
MKRSKGFTLIELLVVISIIALLLSIVMPSLKRVKEQARNTICQTNLHGMSYAFHTYLDDNKNTYPLGWVNTTYSKAQDIWFVAMQPYYDDKKVLRCPSTSDSKEVPFGTWRVEKESSLAGALGVDETYELSYVINGHVQSFENTVSYTDKWKKSGQKGAFNIPVLLDGFRFFQGRTITPYDEPPPYQGAYSVAGLTFSFMIDRHNGTNNALFMDHSLREIGIKQLYTLKWSPVFDRSGPWTLAGHVSPVMWPTWLQKYPDY